MSPGVMNSPMDHQHRTHDEEHREEIVLVYHDALLWITSPPPPAWPLSIQGDVMGSTLTRDRGHECILPHSSSEKFYKAGSQEKTRLQRPEFFLLPSQAVA